MTKKTLDMGQPHEMEIIEAFLEHVRRAGGTEATLRARRELLYRMNRELPYGIGQTSPEELGAWLYREEWSRNTRATYYCGMKAFYGWAADPADPWISADPTVGLEPCTRVAGLPRPVTDEELRRILTEAIEPYRTWAKLAAYQGIRCIEISRLDREHITQQQLIVVKGKGGWPRAHDTHEIVWEAVKDLPPGPVARDEAGNRATPFDVSVRAAGYFRYRLGMPGVGLHRLRHWMGVNVQRTYRDIRVTQAMLGHRSLSSTQVYTMADDQQQRDARATLPRFA